MDSEKLKELIGKYREDIFQDAVSANEMESFYRGFAQDKLRQISETNLENFIIRLWAMGQWGDRLGRVRKFIFPKNQPADSAQMGCTIADLVYGEGTLAERWDNFDLAGFGPAMKSEILFHFYRRECIVWNNRTRDAFGILGITDTPVHNYQVSGEVYQKMCGYAGEIVTVMKNVLEKDISMTEVNEFVWLLSKYGDKPGHDSLSEQSEILSSESGISLHNELKEKIAEIGVLLGFESDTEFKVSENKRADAVWTIKIGNMGKITYVFEVQDKGSIDSLLVSLQTAAQQAGVQAVVAVSNEEQLSKIKARFVKMGDASRKLKTWSDTQVLKVHENLVEANEALNALGLFRDSE